MAKVAVILTHQLDCNRKYLDLALRGLGEQTFKDFEIILVSGAETAPKALYNHKSHWDKTLDTATKKIHWGIQNSKSEFILLHSDDVVLSKEALGEMVSASDVMNVIMNPFSNSDCRSLYHSDFGLKKPDGSFKQLIHDMSMEDIEGWEDALLDFPLGRRILVPVQTLSFYCTMMRRASWDLVGELDPALEYRHNDQDFCIRAKQLQIPSVVNLSPFAFHFGSKTLQHLATDEIKAQATAHFLNKYRPA